MYTGNLRGHKEFIFRQRPGQPAHIVVNADDFYKRLHSPVPYGQSETLAIETYCHKRTRYGMQSMFEGRSAVVRNACEDCFLTYEPQDEEDKRAQDAETEKIRIEPDLPF